MANNGESTEAISLPKGGGAISGIGETFQPDLFTGTGNFTIPISTSPGRSGFGPKLSLQYSTGNGNGPFGLGWKLSIPRVTRKTEKGFPRYTDDDVFTLSGAEDLVISDQQPLQDTHPVGYSVIRYRPRAEGLFARIEKWTRNDGEEKWDIHWRAITKDNVTSIYGKSKSARITDPDHGGHVYEWLLEETYDNKGNHVLYEYVQENPDVQVPAIYEQNKRVTQTYLRRILYGNTPDSLDTSLEVGLKREATHHLQSTQALERHYLFEVLFDYGDVPDILEIPHIHPTLENNVIPPTTPVREDPFSSFRSGFEIRTLRRCRRVLMLHHFKELEGAPLVRSLDLEYEVNPDTKLSLLTAAQAKGYRDKDGAYFWSEMPPVSFSYSAFKPHEQHYQSVTAKGNDLPPRPLTHQEFALVDLFGDALPDILQMTNNGHYFWQNLGNGNVDRRQIQTDPIPAVSTAQASAAFGDMGGDGLVDLVVEPPPLAGFYESTPDGRWQRFKKFKNFPSIDLNDPNLRMLDLTGDGLSDILITRDHHFLWFQSLGETGYAEPQHIDRVHDLNEFPDVYFDDPSGRVRLADMTADGLMDIVLVHNGRIDYWPNLGYGRFGRRVTMKETPRLPANVNPRQVFLVDLDGSGCANLVYVDFKSVHFWFNQSGNGWSAEQKIQGTPYVSDFSAIQFADFFGTGTTSLIWSYDYTQQTRGNYKVLDFNGGQKPYLLTEMRNNMGATTRVQYAASTKFYLEDKAARTPWATNLPFPVQVVEKSEAIDHISKTKLVTTYKFHHGYYDGREREFRGFGRVDQYDSEEFELFSKTSLHGAEIEIDNKQKAYHVPPILTKTWFHTGVYFDEDNVSPSGAFYDHNDLMEAYKKEFYQGDPQAFSLENHNVEHSGTPHEAYRGLRGAAIRSEVFALDGTDRAEHPYTVAENRYRVNELQPKDKNNHAVYLTTQDESITYHYERNPQDPRIAQSLTLAVDEYGQITDSVSVAYPRRQAPPELPQQAEIKISYAKTDLINKANEFTYYYIGVPYQTRTFEVTGVDWSPSDPPLKSESFSDLMLSPENFQPFEWQRPEGHVSLEKRLIEWQRSYFRTDASAEHLDITPNADGHPTRTLSNRLPLGEIDTLALPYESFSAALSNDLLALHFTNTANVETSMLLEGGYHQEPDVADYWWLASGQTSFNEDLFYLSELARGPFGFDTQLSYDPYALFPIESRDALDNATKAHMDYRVLQPSQVTDPNGNHGFAAFDTLGMVVGTAVRSKTGEGDTLKEFERDLSKQQIRDYLDKPQENGANLLAGATSRMIYDLWTYSDTKDPTVVATMSREIHRSELETENSSPIQHSFLYSDGFGRTVQSKVQAEPDPAIPHQPRWAGTGTTIYNNKGKPVRQYEPFFSDSHHYGIEQHGVSPTLFYDPLERVVATLHPNHAFEKIVFDPWRQESWDVNDTVLKADPKIDPDVGAYFKHLLKEDYLPSWHDSRKNGQLGDDEKSAAEKSAAHAGTPSVAHLDVMGRTVLTVADNAEAGKYTTRVELDIEGNQIKVIDAKNRIVMQYDYDLLSNPIKQHGMDAGERWMLNDVSGNPIRAWDSRGHTFRSEYDELRRPIGSFVKGADATDPNREILFQRTVYGEAHPDSVPAAGNLNLRGRVYLQLDSAGVIFNTALNPESNQEQGYDFKSNSLRSTRQLYGDYQALVDWIAIEPLLAVEPPTKLDVTAIRNALIPFLEPEHFLTSTRYDALNRAIQVIVPHSNQSDAKLNVIQPTYNEANLLNSVDVWTEQSAEPQEFLDPNTADPHGVKNIDYDAKGQRERIEYGNGVLTAYEYDEEMFRLIHLKTTRAGFPANKQLVQDLHYAYDPAGNISAIRDNAQQSVYFNNAVVEPHTEYWYDAIYRLIEAHGREHLGQLGGQLRPPVSTSHTDAPRANLNHSGDGGAMGNYTETYQYDEIGNMEEVNHVVTNAPPPTPDHWVRKYAYQEPSLIESGKTNNRLSTTTVGNETVAYEHDKQHGFMTKMPHLEVMEWDFEDQLHRVDLNGGGEAWYVYDAAGQRVRKIVVKNNGNIVEERIYLGGFEVFRKRTNGDVKLEHETLHIMDDAQRVAMVETKTIDTNNDPSPVKLVRYQFGNHLGSASLELDDDGKVISYEEYFPYGGTAYQAVDKNIKAVAKRYRFTGKERDEETGLYYHGARYYAPWLGRWTTVDPGGLVDGPNLYVYVSNNPIKHKDLTGLQEQPTLEKPLKAPSGTLFVPEFNPGFELNSKGEIVPIPQTTEESSKEIWFNLIKPQMSEGKAISPPTSDWRNEQRQKWTLMTDEERKEFRDQEWAIHRGPNISRKMPQNFDAMEARIERYGLNEAHNEGVLQGFMIADTTRLGAVLAARAAFRLEGELIVRGYFSETYEFTNWGAGVEVASHASGRTPLMTYDYGVRLGEDMGAAGYELVLGKYPGNVQYVNSMLGTFTIDRPWGWTKMYNAGGVRGVLNAGGSIRFTSETFTGTFELEAKQIFIYHLW